MMVNGAVDRIARRRPPSARSSLATAAAVAILLGALIVSGCRADIGRASRPGPGSITVNSVSDRIAADGGCTLREAIAMSNGDFTPGNRHGECASTGDDPRIEFHLDGEPLFTVQGQRGYTIRPASPLPSIRRPLTIDGYSQPGSRVNTAHSPLPLDSILLVELDGSEAGLDASGIVVRSDDVQVRGLVIGGFTFDGVNIDGRDVAVTGSYVGTNATGDTANPNQQRGVASGPGTSRDVRIGGVTPADRNILSGNVVGAGNANVGHDRWVFQGNFIGVGRDGIRAIPNGEPDGSGALSLDDSSGHLVGGTERGAANVISGNRSHGIAPFHTTDLRIEANYVGVGADGSTLVANAGAGITFGGGSIGAAVIDNVFGANNLQAMVFNDGSPADQIELHDNRILP